MRILEIDGAAAVVAWRAERCDGERVVHGVVGDLSMVAPLLTAASREPLLPPTLTSRAPTADVLALRVTAPTGREVFAASTASSEFTSDVVLDPRLGGVTVRAALAPGAASSLVIGGLPRSRLPWLYGLIALAASLAGVAVWQGRREIKLARMRGDFVSGVSHELRTPLAQIRMFAETLVLGRVRSEAESRRSLEIILRESQRLSHLVDNVLCFSRTERGMVALHKQPVVIRKVFDELVESVEPFARARRTAIRVGVPADMTSMVDPTAVRQMLLNLVDNALKYGPEGQTIQVTASRDHGHVRFAVEDEGPGIPDAIADRIWDPFWRAPGSAQGGSGIGLSIVRDLARAHDGRAFTERAAARGARFVIEIPAA
jgi:signal transduction histidine kinase